MAAPVPFGEALSKGKEVAFANYVPLIIGVLVMGVPILGILCAPGVYYMALKCVRGQKPDLGADLFIIFKGKLVDHIIMLILTGLCCIITLPLFWPGTYLLLDNKAGGWSEAMNKAMAETKPNLVGWLICLIVCFLPCICFFLAPISLCAVAYCYDKTFGGGGGGAPAEPAKA